jgi:glycosyltransferase 2 family protein
VATGPGSRLPGWLRSRRVRNLLRFAVLAAFGAVLLVVLARRWHEVRPLLHQLSVAGVALAALAVFSGIYTTFLCWRAVLTDLGSPLPLGGGMRVFFLGQLGKYLPGSLWPLLAQMELGRDYKVPRRASGAAVAIFLLLILGTGLLVAAIALPLLGGDALRRYWWVLLVLPVAAVLLWPPVLNRLIALALRLAHREPMPTPLSLPGVLRAVGWALVSWLLYGIHVWVLARMLGVGGVGILPRSIGAFAAAWCVGFLVVIAPAGGGAREAALIVLLGTGVGAARATVIAVVSRLLFTVGDLGWGGAVALAVRRRNHTPEPEQESVG